LSARFIGVGVGPGDPELITLKAARLIREADVVGYIANTDGASQARSIAADVLAQANPGQRELPVLMPMLEQRDRANRVYDEAAASIQLELDAGQSVVFLCEGDPLFFGSFGYLLIRLEQNNRCSVVPGISSVNAASSALCLPLTVLSESFAVISGRHDEQHLVDVLNSHDSVVIMKAGRARPRILAALAQTGRSGDARYLEYIGRDNEMIETDVRRLAPEAGPYFSIFVVTPAARNIR
jgi:precorrin-2/cobalt-factor-2 C20-methyltransferase